MVTEMEMAARSLVQALALEPQPASPEPALALDPAQAFRQEPGHAPAPALARAQAFQWERAFTRALVTEAAGSAPGLTHLTSFGIEIK